MQPRGGNSTGPSLFSVEFPLIKHIGCESVRTEGGFLQTVLCLHVADPLLCAPQAAGQVKQTFITGSALESHLLWAPIVRKQILSTFLPFLLTVDIDSWARLGDLGLFPRISGMVREDFSLQLKREKMKYVWVGNGLDDVQMVNKSTITVGSYDFWNHWITYVTELACKNGNLLINCKLTGIFRSFWDKEELFLKKTFLGSC